MSYLVHGLSSASDIQMDLLKSRARFCAQGDKQLKGIDFFDTYAPVVQWTTTEANVHLGDSPQFRRCRWVSRSIIRMQSRNESA
jgi:hypothetical protein